jgi:hypothetical protein
VEFGAAGAGVFVRIIFAALANVGQEAAENRAMDGIVAASVLARFMLAAVALHGGLFKSADAASANCTESDAWSCDDDNMMNEC